MTYAPDGGAVLPAPIVRLGTVDSTNAEALRLARGGTLGPLWIVAEQQTAGRGRRGRPWVSLPGNLYATLLLTDPAPVATAAQLGFVAGLALRDAVVSMAPALAPRLTLKWPNDLLLAERKIAGILVEGEGSPVRVAIGFGVNCRHHPAGSEFPATDFAAEGAGISPTVLSERLAAAFMVGLEQWNRGAGFAAIQAGWLASVYALGRPVRVRLPAREMVGRFEGLDQEGRLVLRTEDRAIALIAAGDVFPLDAETKAVAV
jgi:BirA family biotin operon repressor/biotin-[acetyl-CoA-carboxylase] ligase